MEQTEINATAAREVLSAISALHRDQDPQVFADALESARNGLLANTARHLLARSFPEHDEAVFVRNWDQDTPSLSRVTKNNDPNSSYDTNWNCNSRPDWMTAEQWRDLVKAERMIAEIGSDDEIAQHLEIDAEDTEFVAFIMVLHPESNNEENP